MLEGLAKIDWASIRHCYGPAADLPDLLRDLVSPDLQRREEALTALYETVWHQGTIYEATSHAVPFLWEILSGSASCDRSGVAALIGAIANPSGYNRSDTGRQEQAWIADCRAAVRNGLGVAESHLTSKDIELRMLCAHVLASFPEDAERFGPALRSALHRETAMERRAGLGMALILLGDQVPSAFTANGPTRLPLNRLQEFAVRAANGLTERKYALDFIFELALSEIDVDTILEWLEDPERWGGEDQT